MLIQRFSHGRNVVRCCTTASTYQVNPSFGEAQSVVCKVIGRGYIEETVTNARRQSCIRLCREQVDVDLRAIMMLIYLGNHLFKCIKCGGRTHAAVSAHHVYTHIAQNSSNPCCRLTREGMAIFIKTHLSNDRKPADLFSSQDGLAQFSHARECFKYQHIASPLLYPFDLFPEYSPQLTPSIF